MKREWKLEKRWCGHDRCFCSLRTVLSFGKWSVSGSTGDYTVTGPDGWDMEFKTPFKDEEAAKAYVECWAEKDEKATEKTI